MMVRVTHINAFVIALITGLTLSYQACSPADGMRFKHTPGGGGNGGWAPQANGGTTTDNPKPTVTVEVGGFPEEGSSSVNIKLCVSKMELRRAGDGGGDEIEVRMTPKWITLSPAGTLIDDGLSVPFGNYERIEMNLSSACSGAYATVTNAFGSFAATDDVSMRFSGEVAVAGPGSKLILDMSDMISRSMRAASNAEFQSALADSEGGCGND